MYTGEQMTFQERLDAILPEVTSDGFLKRNKLSGEIPFYVFDYLPEDELKMRGHILFMEERIKKHHPGIKFRHVRLFHLMIEHLTERGNIEKAYDREGGKDLRHCGRRYLRLLSRSGLLTSLQRNIILRNVTLYLSAVPVLFGPGSGRI